MPSNFHLKPGRKSKSIDNNSNGHKRRKFRDLPIRQGRISIQYLQKGTEPRCCHDMSRFSCLRKAGSSGRHPVLGVNSKQKARMPTWRFVTLCYLSLCDLSGPKWTVSTQLCVTNCLTQWRPDNRSHSFLILINAASLYKDSSL